MKRLSIEHVFYYFENQIPSKSFLEKLSEAVTKQISDYIDDPELKKCFTSVISLRFGMSGHVYDIHKPSKIQMRVEAKSIAAFTFAYFTVIWKVTDADYEGEIFPWSDVSKLNLTFRMIMERSEIRKMNYILPQLYTPVIRGSDVGLPYDYQIKNQSPDGKLFFKINTGITQKEINEINDILQNFFDKCKSENEYVIHYIGDPKVIKKSNSISVVIDLGSSEKYVIEECIKSFKNLEYISKIIYR